MYSTNASYESCFILPASKKKNLSQLIANWQKEIDTATSESEQEVWQTNFY